MYITLLFMTNPESTIYGSDELLKAYAIFTIAVLSTIYNLMSIGIERYLSVAECTRMRARVLKWQIVAAVSGNWGLAVLFGCLPLAGWNCLHKGHSSNLYSPFCTDYLAFITIPNCMVAFVCLLVTYFKIIFILKKQKTAIAAHDLAFKNTYKTAEMQVTRTSISIWILTAVSYVPFFAGVLWDSFNHSCREELHTGVYIFRNITAVMFTVNAIGNPIIYTMKFKKLGSSRTPLRCRDNDNAQLRAQVNI
ncbi:lysophosphatidic acid receptor 3-like [Polypterus senegalus]|uniref:lysophosphatidic acid receptor 3-like n=1 Tax=Polypterus senegalus TaxID=55291 RepID=UPI0019631C69|nr:lysophosphatidic acid receptor 3-like [Polypterus senegalus]